MEFFASLLAPLSTPAGWGEVAILMFLELALGIDNLVFISITSDRLPPEKQHIGRRLGLAAAMVMRCILLCCVVAIMSINVVVFTLPFGVEGGHTAMNVRDLVFLAGGAYLVYKGVAELRESFQAAAEAPAGAGEDAPNPRKRIGLAHAVAVIMVMDIVFSLDSVITAAGLSGHILVMIIAVIGAVMLMIVFADYISNFINRNYEVKIVALAFIMLVGVELLLEAFHIEQVFGAPIPALLYAMMIFGFATSLLIMLQRHVRDKALAEQGGEAAHGEAAHDGVAARDVAAHGEATHGEAAQGEVVHGEIAQGEVLRAEMPHCTAPDVETPQGEAARGKDAAAKPAPAGAAGKQAR